MGFCNHLPFLQRFYLSSLHFFKVFFPLRNLASFIGTVGTERSFGSILVISHGLCWNPLFSVSSLQDWRPPHTEQEGVLGWPPLRHWLGVVLSTTMTWMGRHRQQRPQLISRPRVGFRPKCRNNLEPHTAWLKQQLFIFVSLRYHFAICNHLKLCFERVIDPAVIFSGKIHPGATLEDNF